MSKPIRLNTLLSGILLSLMVILYVYIYYDFERLTSIYSKFAVNKVFELLTIGPALMAAFIAVLIVMHFSPKEPLFRVWLMLALGWGFWALGELSYLPYDFFYPQDYPDFSFIDFCWLAGYFLLGLALYYQIRLVYSGKKHYTAFYLVIVGVVLLITYGLTNLVISYGLGGDSPRWVVYLSVLYPVLDIFEGGAAIWLSFLYGRGIFGRVWWALISFTIADAASVFFWLGGGAWLSEGAYFLVDMLSAVTYALAYAIAALSLLVSYNLLRYGYGAARKPR
ncbi:MAG: hypothetical protein Fur002_17140 [Anaerolineales bacterium]